MLPLNASPAGSSPLDFRQAALLMLAFSVTLYVAGAWLGSRLVRRLGPNALQPGWLIQAARFAYYVLFPYALVLRGAGLLPGLLGVLGPEPLSRSLLGWSTAWLAGMLWAAGGAGVGALLLWWGLRAGGLRPAYLPRGWALLREVAFQQAHWAFYRAALAVWLGVYGALFISLLVLAAEAAADPRTWARLREPAGASGLIVIAATAWLSAGVFLFTGNLWLTAAAHVLALLPLTVTIPAPAPAPPGE